MRARIRKRCFGTGKRGAAFAPLALPDARRKICGPIAAAPEGHAARNNGRTARASRPPCRSPQRNHPFIL
eukprot:6217242-Pyramimonas_sp.AAC.1